MAFFDRYTPDKEVRQCPVCRQIIKEGRIIREAAYRSTNTDTLCRNCYDYYYTNSKARRTAGIHDNPSSLPVQIRPAEPLENDRLFQREKPACGYEFRLSYILTEQILRNVIFWVSLCLALRLLLWIGGGSSYDDMSVQSPSWMVLRIFITAGSAVWAVGYAVRLIQGIFNGMGYTRRLVLLAAIIIMALLVLLLY